MLISNTIVLVCPVGNYGKSCTGRCHCDNGERCIYRNGSCVSSKCKEGWTGSSCNVRGVLTLNICRPIIVMNRTYLHVDEQSKPEGQLCLATYFSAASYQKFATHLRYLLIAAFPPLMGIVVWLKELISQITSVQLLLIFTPMIY